MWFNRKPTNRRHRRDHLLDVKLRSDRLRSDRLRFTARAGAILFCAAVAVLVVLRGGRWALDEFVYRNPAFAIKEVEVHTDGIILPDKIRAWAGVKVADNLFALDLLRVKRDLELMPLIHSAAVERVLPGTLRLRITEREPLAQVFVARPAAKGGYEQAVYQIDPEGYVMIPLERRFTTDPTGQNVYVLPVLTGVSEVLLQPGRRVESPQLQAALQLLNVFDHSPMGGLVDIKRIDVATPEILRLTTGYGGEVLFSTTNLDLQLRRWRSIHDNSGRAVATMDLSVSNNIPVRWMEAAVAPPTTPKAAKPSRIRKKNV